MKRNSLLTAFCVWVIMLNAQTLTIQSGSTVYTKSSGNTPTLNVTGSIQNNGNLSMEGGISGNQDLILSGTLSVPIGGTTLGAGYDQLNVSGAVTLSGALTITLVNGYTPMSGTSFTIIDGTSLSGTFSAYNFPSLSGGLTWSIGYNGSAGTAILTVTAVLPVELLDFNAKADLAQRQILLNWATALEDNTQSFIVERSRDGQHFIPLSTQKAKGSHAYYNDVDVQPFNGINYYRLKIVDKDGKMSYSKVVSAIMGEKTYKIKAFPTLVTDELNVTTDGGTINSLEVVNTAGQIVFSKYNAALSQNGMVQLSLGHLPHAVYFLRAKNTEGVVATIKFVKQ